MAWIKLDDGFFRNPKIVTISAESKLIYLAGLCYAGASLTDGFIPKNAVRMLASDADVSSPQKRAQELVDAGLWVENPRGYSIHDYLEHNTSASDVLAKREAARERMQAKRSGSSREVPANKPRTYRKVQKPETEAETEAETGAKAPIGADAPTSPEPIATTETPYALLEVLCEAQGQDVSVLSSRDKSKQLAVAKRLLEDGMTADSLTRLLKWLLGQSWVTGGVDFFLVEKQFGKWKLAGEPGKPFDSTLTRMEGGRVSQLDAVFAQAARDLGLEDEGDISAPDDVIDTPFRRTS